MPVLECSCGMVMSATATKLRNTCIRCGSASLSEFAQGQTVDRAADLLSSSRSTTGGDSLASQSHEFVSTAVDQFAAAGVH